MPHDGYIAEQNPDGTWDILDVPIFSETTLSTLEGDGFHFSEEWMQAAVDWHQWKYSADGYREPLNERHDSDKRGKIPAGKILPTHVAPFHFEDRDQPTTFAHLQQIPEWVYARIKSGEIEYLSVECNDVRFPRFAACALMADTSPHHKYPPIRIREERVRGRTFKPEGALGAATSADAPLALVASSENPLRRVATMKKATSRDKIPNDPQGRYIFRFADGTLEFSDKADAFEFEDGADKGDETNNGAEAMDGGMPDLSTLTVDQLADLLKLVEEAMEKLKPGGGEETPPKEAEMGKQPAEPVAMSEAATKKAIEAMEQAGRAEATANELRERLDKTACFEEARNSLTGYTFQDEELDKAYEFAGAKGVEFFVTERKKHGRRVPIDAAAATPENTPAADIPGDYEFSSDAATFREQMKASRMYDDPRAASIRSKFTRKQFIDARTKGAAELARAGGDNA